jgi:hypothetical protein
MASYHAHRRRSSYSYPDTYSSPIKGNPYYDYSRYYGASSPPASSSPIAASLPPASSPYTPTRHGRGHARIHSSPSYNFDARARFAPRQDAYTLPAPKRTHVPAQPDSRKALQRLSLPPASSSSSSSDQRSRWRLPSFRESFPDEDGQGTLPGPPEFHFDDLEDACEPPAHPREEDDVMRAPSVPETRFDGDESAVDEADEEALEEEEDDDEDDGVAVVVSPTGNRRFSTSSERDHYTPKRLRTGSIFATPKADEEMSMVAALLNLRRSLFAPAPPSAAIAAPTTAATLTHPSPPAAVPLAPPAVHRSVSETEPLASCPPLSGPSSASTERSDFHFASTPFDGELTVHAVNVATDDKLPPSSAPVSPVLVAMDVEQELKVLVEVSHTVSFDCNYAHVCTLCAGRPHRQAHNPYSRSVAALIGTGVTSCRRFTVRRPRVCRGGRGGPYVSVAPGISSAIPDNFYFGNPRTHRFCGAAWSMPSVYAGAECAYVHLASTSSCGSLPPVSQ